MSIVSIAFVPQGIAVAADSRSSDIIENKFLLGTDCNMKIVYIEKYNVFFTLCGCPVFKDDQGYEIVFQPYIYKFIDAFKEECFRQNIEPNLKFMINFFKDYTFEHSGFTDCDMFIAGYERKTGVPYVVKYSKRPFSLFDENGNWCIESLNQVPVDDQNIMNEWMIVPSYGFAASGITTLIENTSNNLIKIGDDEIPINQDTSLNEAVNICRYVVEYTINNLERINYNPVCGGPVSSFYIENPNNLEKAI